MLTTLKKQSSGRCLLIQATTPGSRLRSRSSESTIVSMRNINQEHGNSLGVSGIRSKPSSSCGICSNSSFSDGALATSRRCSRW